MVAIEENYTNHDVVSVTESTVSHVLYPLFNLCSNLIVPVISNLASCMFAPAGSLTYITLPKFFQTSKRE